MTEPLLMNNQELTWGGLPVYQSYELYVGEFGTALADVFQMDPAHYTPFAVLASAHSIRYNFDAPLQENFSFGVGASGRYSFGASAHSIRYNFDAPLQENFSFGVGASGRYSFGEALA